METHLKQHTFDIEKCWKRLCITKTNYTCFVQIELQQIEWQTATFMKNCSILYQERNKQVWLFELHNFKKSVYIRNLYKKIPQRTWKVRRDENKKTDLFFHKRKSGIIFNKEFTFPSIITDVTFVLFTRKIDWATFTNKQRSFHCILSSNSHPPPPKKLLLVVKNCKRRKSQLVLSNFGKFDPLWINVYK